MAEVDHMVQLVVAEDILVVEVVVHGPVILLMDRMNMLVVAEDHINLVQTLNGWADITSDMEK